MPIFPIITERIYRPSLNAYEIKKEYIETNENVAIYFFICGLLGNLIVYMITK